MKMEFELFSKVFQKDVNNYILIGDDGKIKSKGGYVKKLSNLDYDLPILNKALINYMVHGISIEDSILKCDELKEFQLVSKISNKYTDIIHGDKKLKEKCIRIFASKLDSDAGVQKISARTGRPEKLTNSPEHCFIYNDEVNEIKVPYKLDKQWYIRFAKSRLADFGVV
ncbi:hypothetical protein SDC9_203146 [bioreactor metagenome]|uniref:Uncharacterized protein n=1 Tax=bioreactor metagenome TaxID=1076179 RepID=A0A645J4Q6_9ZZZZ